MSSKDPGVSVVIPLYNHEREVERAIRSVLAQTFQGFEIIVVNDGSTDRGAEIVASLREERIRLFHQENQGVSAARNRGIAETRGELVAFLDADDEWREGYLAEIMRLHAAFPSASVFATAYLFCDGDGAYTCSRINGLPQHPWQGIIEDYFTVAARSDPPLCSSAITVTKEAIVSVGGFPVGVRSGEDLLTWARLSMRFPIAYSTLPCAVFWRPQSVYDRPGRHGDPADIAGSELRRLLGEIDDARKPGLQKYLFQWHKSRASILLRRAERARALHEIWQGFRYQHVSPKMCCYLVLSLLPSFLSRRLTNITLTGYRRLTQRAQCEGMVNQQRSHAGD